MKKVFVLSLGCPRNLVDSEVLCGKLVSLGFFMADSAEEADIAIVNTCGFIEEAKKESVDCILQLAEMKKDKRLEKLIVTGCLAQRYPEELDAEITELDAIFGSSDFLKIPDLLLNAPARSRVRSVSASPGYLYDHNSPRCITGNGHSAYVKIQEGCSSGCSYCVIPSIKGPRRSRDVDSVLSEVSGLREKYGVKEIVLIGQDTTSFGFDRSGGHDIAVLLKEVSGIMIGGWVRLLYTHPAHFPDRLIDVIASSDNICRYVDLPIQHASDDVLRRMNRECSREMILSLVEKIRSRIDGAVIRTSVIVGFPGETEQNFSELTDLLEQVKFERLGAFVYSREEGTPAAGFTSQVPEKTKRYRFQKVMELQQAISSEKNKGFSGKTFRVLIDERDGADEGLSVGRTEMDAPEVDGVVYVRGAGLSPGDFVDVKITGVMEYDLIGDAV
jgi:ribosomal protein S12 methylthiotransferase